MTPNDEAHSARSQKPVVSLEANNASEASDAKSDRTAGLARWVSILTSVGALIGLLLVVVQLQQNRDLMRAEIRHELAMSIVDLLNTPASNSQLASVLRRGYLGEPLTADEMFQFQLRSNALLRYWEDVHYQYREGLYDEIEFSTQTKAWRAALESSVGLTSYWCKVRTLYSPLFRSEMDDLHTTDCEAVSPAA